MCFDQPQEDSARCVLISHRIQPRGGENVRIKTLPLEIQSTASRTGEYLILIHTFQNGPFFLLLYTHSTFGTFYTSIA